MLHSVHKRLFVIIMPYVLILAFGFILQLKGSLAIVEGTVSDQLAYLIGKKQYA